MAVQPQTLEPGGAQAALCVRAQALVREVNEQSHQLDYVVVETTGPAAATVRLDLRRGGSSQ